MRSKQISRPDVDDATHALIHRRESTTPLVSVIIATHNRSNVLVHALRSLRAQTLTDWEGLVIGDACTDDSEDITRSFGDPRLTWIPVNPGFGEQSGPNSTGARLACGHFIVWMNHDDLWFPDHLESLVYAAGEHDADLVASGWMAIGPHDQRDLEKLSISAKVQTNKGSSRIRIGAGFYPASTWLVRRDVVEHVGDWRPARDLRDASSQDFLYRCWARGGSLHFVPRPSVIAIQSGLFKHAYAMRRSLEHDRIAPLLSQYSVDDFLKLLETHGSVGQSSVLERLRRARQQRTLVRRLTSKFVLRLPLWAIKYAGINPWEARARLAGKSRGEFINDLRRVRGLPGSLPS